MPSLSSLLVQREVASMRTVEEAITRQVLHGGDLPTNLLELAAVREEDLIENLAESFRMPAAPAGQLPTPDPAVLRVVPADVAFRHGIFPLARDEQTLYIATSEPLSQAVEEDLSFSLNVSLAQLIAPLVRIRQAIAASYGIPLDRRMMRLVAKLEGRPDPSPTVAPPAPGRSAAALPPSQMPRPVSVPPPKFGTGLPPPPLEDEPEEAGGVPSSSVASEIPPIPPVPGMPRLRPFDPTSEPGAQVGVEGMADPGGVGYARVDPPRSMRAADATQEWTSPEGSEASAPPPSVAPTSAKHLPRGPLGANRDLIARRGLASWLRRTVLEEKGRAAHESQERAAPRPRRKGPFTAAIAEQELEEAVTTEEVLTVYFAFARQFFTFSFLFVVHGDIAEGHFVWGPGAGQMDPTAIGVPLSLPSSFSLARKRRAPVIARLATEGIDAEFSRDLGRSRGSDDARAAAAVIPVVVRNRVVALLYGDDGNMPVELSAVGEVIAVTALTAGALERLILRRKLTAFRSEGTPAPTEPAPVAEEAPPPPADAAREAAEGLAERPPPPSVNRRGPGSIRRQASPSLPPEIEVGEVGWSVIPPPSEEVPSPRDTLPAGSMPGDVMWSSEGDTYAGMGPEVEHALLRGSGGAAGQRSQAQDDDWVDVGAEAELIEEEEDEGAPWWADPASQDRRPIPRAAVAPAPVPAELLRRPFTEKPIPREEPEAEEPAGNAGEPGDSLTERWSRSAPEKAAQVDLTAPPGVSVGRIQLVERAADASLEAPAEPLEAARSATSSPPPAEESSGLRGLRSRLAPLLGPRNSEPPARKSWEPTPPPPNVQAELQPLLNRVLAKAPDADRAFVALVESGEQAMPLLIAEFPGPLTVERARARDVLPPASRCGPLLELIVAMGRPAVASLGRRSSSSNPEFRFWATHALGELPYAESATAVLPRLFDEDPSIRRVARRSARALVAADVGAAIVQGVGHVARNIDEPTRRRVYAIESMGEIRAGVVVSALISALGDPTEDVSEAARRALFVITRQDFEVDAQAWAEWWRESAGRHRIEWLIDALVHDSPVVRRAAADELMEETGEYYGYAEDLTPDERSRVQGYYREWWETDGRARFSAGDES